mmetsp:Transcript_15268/g.39266  ORF Transcript_15268/g.39266 Transcript_15268/m.39266 type:complete len:293 (-) Transcript_15268:72-950(-)
MGSCLACPRYEWGFLKSKNPYDTPQPASQAKASGGFGYGAKNESADSSTSPGSSMGRRFWLFPRMFPNVGVSGLPAPINWNDCRRVATMMKYLRSSGRALRSTRSIRRPVIGSGGSASTLYTCLKYLQSLSISASKMAPDTVPTRISRVPRKSRFPSGFHATAVIRNPLNFLSTTGLAPPGGRYMVSYTFSRSARTQTRTWLAVGSMKRPTTRSSCFRPSSMYWRSVPGLAVSSNLTRLLFDSANTSTDDPVAMCVICCPGDMGPMSIRRDSKSGCSSSWNAATNPDPPNSS